MLLQVAVRDIGQLTDFVVRRSAAAARSSHGRRPPGDRPGQSSVLIFFMVRWGRDVQDTGQADELAGQEGFIGGVAGDGDAEKVVGTAEHPAQFLFPGQMLLAVSDRGP
jgi:hypothetical protein